MSVAKCLGVDNLDSPEMREARSSWPRWCEDEPALAVLDDLRYLSSWMRRSEPDGRDAVVSALVGLGASQQSASLALVWLLTPGATLLAGRLRNLADDIDEIVAGQLWIQVRSHDPSDDKYVAAKILKRTEREVKAELGVGDLARRRDPKWASVLLVDRCDESFPTEPPGETEDPINSTACCVVRWIQACCRKATATFCLIWPLLRTGRERQCVGGGRG